MEKHKTEVCFNAQGRQAFPYIRNLYRVADVVGESLDHKCYRIVWKGGKAKSVHTITKSYLKILEQKVSDQLYIP